MQIFEKSIPNTTDDVVLRPSISEFRGSFRSRHHRRPRWFFQASRVVTVGYLERTSFVGTKNGMSQI